ncbi:hypothetical protein KEM54_006050 [Ascosphaera aggregata]|nr:hypothetical protein KEM54_006050 [Ascosphaera aggregata]
MTAKQPTPPLEALSPSDGGVRKRVCKACDRCRLKKSKVQIIFHYLSEREVDPFFMIGTDETIRYVEMLEQQQSQLVAGLQELYRRMREGKGWPGEPLQNLSNGHPLTHDILERLGALKPAKGSEEVPTFEEDLTAVQRKLIASGAGFMPRDTTSDFGSEGAPSPTIPTSNPFGVNDITYPTSGTMSFPPTPPLNGFQAPSRKRLIPTQHAQLSAAQCHLLTATNCCTMMQQTPPTSAGSARSYDCHTRVIGARSPRKRAATMDRAAPCPPASMFFNLKAMNPDLLRTSAEAYRTVDAVTPLTPISVSPNSTTSIMGPPVASPTMNAEMPANLDDCVDFIDHFDTFNVFSPTSTHSTIPDWTEVEDLKLFLDPGPQMI